jgi:hypothetical protein
MRRAATLALLALLTAVAVQAQPQTGSSTQPGSTAQTGTNAQAGAVGNPTPVAPNTSAAVIDQIAAGTEIRATLDTPLSSKTSKPGDRFTATIADPARGTSNVVIPAGARVEGEVAEADDSKTMAALKDKNALSVRFRDVVLPDGQTLPLSATLISVNNTNGMSTRKNDSESRVQQGSRGRDVARDAGIGSAAGTAFGAPLKGLATGALAGGGYVLDTKGKDVSLPAQTGLVIRLDQPVTATAAPAPPPQL